MHALIGRVRQGLALEPDPGIQTFHETGALGQRDQRVNHAAVHQPEVAGVRRHLHAARIAEQLIEPARARALEPGFVGAVAPHGIHHFCAGRPAREHQLDQRGRMLQVGVQADHHVAGGGFQARAQRSFLAEIAGQLHMAKALVFGPLRHQRFGAVGAAVVGHDDFPAGAQRRQPVAQKRQQHAQVLALVQARNDAGDTGVIRHVSRLRRPHGTQGKRLTQHLRRWGVGPELDVHETLIGRNAGHDAVQYAQGLVEFS